MRFNNIRLSKCLLKKELQKSLRTILSLKSNEVEYIFNINKCIKKNLLTFPRYHIIKSCMLLRKHNVNIKPLTDLHSTFLLSNNCLEHRINILKDMGVSQLNVSFISRMISLFGNKLLIFKKITNIPAEQSITKNIFSRFGHEIPNNILHLELNNKLTVAQYYKACFLHCKTEIFDLPYLPDNKILYYNGKYKSLSMIAETLKLFRSEFGYDEKMIKKYAFAINASAENIKLLLNNFDEICGMPVMTFLKNYPYVLLQDMNNIKQLLISLKRYNISNKQIKKHMNIFKMDNNIFLERIEKIKRHPDLHIWLKSPRILKLIIHMNVIMKHINFRHKIDCIKWAHLHIMLSKKVNLEKLAQENIPVLSKNVLKYVLLKELEIDSIDLINMLKRHHNWEKVSLIEICQVLKYLKKYFTISEICHNIHIIFYTQPRIHEVLVNLRQQYSENTEYSFTNSQYLALCVYMLEKENNFVTNDGATKDIHSNKNKAKQQSSDFSNFDLSNDNVKNIYGNLENKVGDVEGSTTDNNLSHNLTSSNITTKDQRYT